ncbi:Serine/Threonine kinase domain protein (macronuclear) [Tetrahymena thermophila SB210]|uniref:Serine/Threonine kinase domain protein n=1 Tax=Tetrahymena thermophila (strain SB210) TaxID=312017 RepID=I7LUV3_TETTS|nr:Serine/Threonine kinase domain protein [Tetrahymena thermophila SB210]EAR96110.2 Serine/Threonine kinase domain protein [Tetrahymena thermophila SB210]|eukprot:XP_001016355.2 Serine/Threonine kinase domain protein [Tetrahymena thermophila SB210]
MILQGYQGKYILKNKILGQGGFSQVFQGKICQDDEARNFVAIKKVSKTTLDGQENKNYEKELEISQKIFEIERNDPCQYIMNIIDFCQLDESYYIITEYYESGDFLTFLNQNFEYFTLDIVLDILIQIVKAINYLHKHNITHRDLKPENILISKQQNMYFVKVADFGSATVSDFSSLSGTPNYMAPEIFYNKILTNSIDIWSFGCLAYEILTKQQFFCGKNAQQVVRQIIQYDECLYKNQNQNDQYFQIHQLIQKYCLQPDPEKRQTAQFIIDELSQLRQTHQQELKTYDFEIINSQEVVFQFEETQNGNLEQSNKQSVFNMKKSQQNNDFNFSKSKFEQYRNMNEIQQLQNSLENSIVINDDKNNFQDQQEIKAEACQDDSQLQTENLSLSMDDDSQIYEDQANQEIQLENGDNNASGQKERMLDYEHNSNKNIEIQQLSYNKCHEDSDYLNQNLDETQETTQKLTQDQKLKLHKVNECSKQKDDYKFLLDAWINESQNKDKHILSNNNSINGENSFNETSQIAIESSTQEKELIKSQNNEISNKKERSQQKQQKDLIFNSIKLQFLPKFSMNQQLSDKGLKQIQKFLLPHQKFIQIPFFYNKPISALQQKNKQNLEPSDKLKISFLLYPCLLGGISVLLNKYI